jgi:AcrR family transcriptional regulator
MPGVTDKRRQVILDAAGELLAVQPTASLAEIAEYAHVGKATLHRYFPSRDDLILALGHRAIETVAAAIRAAEPEQGAVIEALRRLIEGLIPLADKMYFLLSEPSVNYDPALREAERLAGLPVEQLVERGQASGDLRADLPKAWLLHVLDYLLYATWQAVYEGKLARRDAPSLLLTTFLNGFGGQR